MPDFTALGHEAIGIITEVGLEVPKERKGEKGGSRTQYFVW